LICGRCITIGNSARFTLDQSKVWRPVGWPKCPPPDHLTRICADLAARAAIGAPHEGLARCVAGGSETFAPAPWLARAANPRLTLFERGVSGLLERHGPAAGCRDAIQGLIGLGPGLTPSGDDFLVGALSVLDAIGEREAHAAMARAIVDALPGRTTPLSACFLRAAAVGHIGENLHQAVSQLLTGDADTAIAAVAKIGHSSGWDMIAGILTTLMIATARRQVRASHVFACS
jgi:hypothetical protein